MKRINLARMMLNNGIDIDRKEILGMEFIRMNDGKYMIKDSNGLIVDEEERIKLENREMIIKDVESNLCQENTTKKLTSNKKRLKELENEENIKETESIKK